MLSMTKDGTTVDFGGAAITGMEVPKENETDPVRKLSVLVEGITVGPVRVSMGDTTLFKMDGIVYTASADDFRDDPGVRDRYLALSA